MKGKMILVVLGVVCMTVGGCAKEADTDVTVLEEEAVEPAEEVTGVSNDVEVTHKTINESVDTPIEEETENNGVDEAVAYEAQMEFSTDARPSDEEVMVLYPGCSGSLIWVPMVGDNGQEYEVCIPEDADISYRLADSYRTIFGVGSDLSAAYNVKELGVYLHIDDNDCSYMYTEEFFPVSMEAGDSIEDKIESYFNKTYNPNGDGVVEVDAFEGVAWGSNYLSCDVVRLVNEQTGMTAKADLSALYSVEAIKEAFPMDEKTFSETLLKTILRK